MSGALERAVAAAARNRARSIDNLAALVRIPSLTGEEGEAQRLIARLLEQLGAELESCEPDVEALFARYPEAAQYPTHWQHDLVLPYAELPSYAALRDSGLETVLNYRDRPNIVGRLTGTGGGRSLILNGHVDTVTIEPADAWTRAPFGAAIEDGVMYGRGTSDMKGGLMAAIMAATYLQEAGARPKGDVIIQSVVNEEHAGNGTLDLVRRGWSADSAIVLEPTDNCIFVGHPGGLYWTVRIQGTQRSPGARWAAGRQDGISAIEKVPLIIDALLGMERDFNREHAGDAAADRQPFSLVFGKIAGGHYETVTAAEVLIRGSAYFLPCVGNVVDVMQRFRRTVAAANDADPFLGRHPSEISFLHHDDAVRQSPRIPLAATAAAVLARRGVDARIVDGPFCCDMRHLVNQGGIPSIVFGPGSIAEAHRPDEHISLAAYTECIEHLLAIICDWCNRDEPR